MGRLLTKNVNCFTGCASDSESLNHLSTYTPEMVARSHPPVVFGAAATVPSAQPDLDVSAFDADAEKLKARAARFHTDFKPASEPAAHPQASKSLFGANVDLLSQEEVEKRRQRARKFGTALVEDGLQPAMTSQQAATSADKGLTAAELAEQRRQTTLTAERRPDTVQLYGTDLMSDSDCLQFFAEYDPAGVERLSETSCNVVFHNADSARRAILGLGTVVPSQDAPNGLGFTEADLGDVTYVWHKGHAKSAVDNFPVDILLRLAIKEVPKQRQQDGAIQGGVRGKKAHRGKGKGRGGRGQQQQQQQKRQFQDLDGDVDMRFRGERGGKRYQRRKNAAAGGQDVDMQDAEGFDDDASYHLTNAEVRQAAAHGNDGFSQQAYGPGTMFSASAAGAAINPNFQQYAPVPTQDFRDVKLIDYGDI